MVLRSAAAIAVVFVSQTAMADAVPDASADKPFASKTYYQASGDKKCEGVSGCIAHLPKIEKGDGIIIRHISCIVAHTGAIFLAAVGVADKKGAKTLDPVAALTVPTAVAYSGLVYSQFNQDVTLRVPDGKLPAIEVLTTAPGGVQIYCLASGEPV